MASVGTPGGAVDQPRELRLVTFNIQYARHIDQAIAVLQSTAPLEHADVITLQEMDAAGTRRIAEALGMYYVYYPATVSPHTHRDFGDAVLSRWPIVADHKIVLPHLARLDKTQRITTGVTVLVGNVPVRIYSMHLGTWVDVSGASKRDQVRAILTDAAQYPRVIIAGDANSHGVGRTFQTAGYTWITESNPSTVHWWNWDHVFSRGLESLPGEGFRTGVVANNLGASDHRPVWAVLSFRAPDSPSARPVVAAAGQ